MDNDQDKEDNKKDHLHGKDKEESGNPEDAHKVKEQQQRNRWTEAREEARTSGKEGTHD